MSHNKQSVFLLLFTLSGFSGLIYQSIWSQYLKLFLGHAAYAQALVIAIFMGGMAGGSWLCSRFSARWSNLFWGYALAEGLVGVLALVFHEVFDQSIRWAYLDIIPALSSPESIELFKWGLAAMLVLPQAVLLGMTFPLMSGAIVRDNPQESGHSISLLYAVNSLGAAAGVLASGFWLIRVLGLPGTVRVAGLINILLALTVWALTKKYKQHSASVESARPREPAVEKTGIRHWYPLGLLVSLMTGVASLIYEISWLRMLSMVLGASTHSFELMLGAFILGLALGSFWIRRRIGSLAHPLRTIGNIQICMGLLALSSLLVYDQMFDLMSWLMQALEKDTAGYGLYNLTGLGISLLLMLPATFCAGMTLPLLTEMLLRKGCGEKSIGSVYAANTLGAILGVFGAIYIGMPLLGLKGLVILGGSIDILLGLLLLWRQNKPRKSIVPLMTTTTACILAVVFFTSFVQLDLFKLTSGVFRTKNATSPQGAKILYHKDGKTATVSVVGYESGMASILTNGKPDASISFQNRSVYSVDQPTQVGLAVIPMALHPDARRVASIGLGSGITAVTLLKNPHIEKVDTVEIEEFIVEGAKTFGSAVSAVYRDPRSQIHISDAKTYFSSNKTPYDIIISEPSNPWVSGVAGLFTAEFYSMIHRQLTKQGVFAQWVQLYETDIDILSSILKAFSVSFPNYAVYALDSANIVLVGKQEGAPGSLSGKIFDIPAVAQTLKRVSIETMDDLRLRKLGTSDHFAPLVSASVPPTNSDYYPYVDQNAVKSMFLGADILELLEIVRISSFLYRPEPDWNASERSTEITLAPYFSRTVEGHESTLLRDYFLHNRAGNLPRHLKFEADTLRLMFSGRGASAPNHRMATLFNMGNRLLPYLTSAELDAVWLHLETDKGTQHLTTGEAQWLRLFKAIGNRQGKQIYRTAIELIENGGKHSVGTEDFLVFFSMTGALMTGDKQEAQRIWIQYSTFRFSTQPPPLYFKVLAGLSSS